MSLSPSAGRTQPIYITELLSLIFSFLDDRSVSRAARVCQQWSDIALDVLWHVVHDPRSLFSLLAPLNTYEQRTSSGTASIMKFRRPLMLSDWERFDRYAHRVRAVNFDCRRGKMRGRQLDQSVYDEMVRTCPRREIIPKLQTMTWYMNDAARQSQSLVFMHGGIRHLSIQLHKSANIRLENYIDAVVSRAPGVTKLEIRSPHPVRDIRSELLRLFGGLHQLKHLAVPMFFLVDEVIAKLASAIHLETINLAEPLEQGTGDRADVSFFSPNIEERGFSRLHTLSFSAHLQHATMFLNRLFAPTHISSLHVNILAIDNPPVLRQLLAAVTRFHRLTDLVLDFVLCPGAPIVTPPPPFARPSLEALRPLFSCRRIRKFEIRWDYQLHLSDHDMDDLARSWPELEHLHLHSEPIPEAGTPSLTLRALLPFACHCPQLRYLALYLDGDAIPARTTSASPPAFRALHKLALGSSPVTVVEPTALFLSQLCPVNCEIVSGVRWPDAFGIALEEAGVTDAQRIQMQDWWIRWGNIGKVLPLAVKARREEKARIATLQLEMESLHMERNLEKERLEYLEREVRKLQGKR
ncbi:hypothetical protein BDW22DRAFT_1362548 [Trametopsis cervina]|nr:hypothetical protein BDW22DRAFT_1362548 [Trametopsis cervina]